MLFSVFVRLLGERFKYEEPWLCVMMPPLIQLLHLATFPVGSLVELETPALLVYAGYVYTPLTVYCNPTNANSCCLLPPFCPYYTCTFL